MIFSPSTNQEVASAHAQPSIAWLVGCIASSATRYWVFFCQKAWRTWGHCITTIFLFTSTHTIPKLVSFSTTTLMHLLLFYAPLKDSQLIAWKGGPTYWQIPRPLGQRLMCHQFWYTWEDLCIAFFFACFKLSKISDKNNCWSEIFHHSFSV